MRLINSSNRKRETLGVKKKILWGILIFVFFVGLAGWLFPSAILGGVAKFLVHGDVLEKSDAIVILEGSRSGSRLAAGVKLFKEGYGPIIVFTGFKVYPFTFSHTKLKNYAIYLGAPEDKIIAELSEEEITSWGEGIANLRLLKKHGAQNFIVVTAGYHSKRVEYVYSKLISSDGYSMKFKVFAVEDPDVPLDGWWKTRYGQRSVFLEYLKLIYYYAAY